MKFDNTKSGALNVRQAKTPAKINKYPKKLCLPLMQLSYISQ